MRGHYDHVRRAGVWTPAQLVAKPTGSGPPWLHLKGSEKRQFETGGRSASNARCGGWSDVRGEWKKPAVDRPGNTGRREGLLWPESILTEMILLDSKCVVGLGTHTKRAAGDLW